tara:strand:+ start:377 stop:673 length:297 start_codon:yes stop_codon:yes gene_type:complete
MRKVIKENYDLIMDSDKNPLRKVDTQVRHMIMQILAFMWSAVFGVYITNSIMAFGISAIAHTLLIAAIFLTAGTFYVADRNPRVLDGRYMRGRDGEHE